MTEKKLVCNVEYFINVHLPPLKSVEYRKDMPACISQRGSKIYVDFDCGHQYIKADPSKLLSDDELEKLSKKPSRLLSDDEMIKKILKK